MPDPVGEVAERANVPESFVRQLIAAGALPAEATGLGPQAVRRVRLLHSWTAAGFHMTCWRRLRAWTQAGVWDQLHALLLAELHAGDQIDWTRAAVDASHVRAKGKDAIGPSPVDRAGPGSKHHVLTDATGIPLAVLLTGGNRHDVTQLKPLLDAVPPIRGRVGRPRRKPRVLVADRGYDFDSTGGYCALAGSAR